MHSDLVSGVNLPLVSAVIPCYNYGRYVCDAVESALAQTYRNMEVIVIDDGSTDDTRSRLQPFESKIRYHFQPNAGLAAARNRGIQLSQGEWIALLDADDLWHPQKTEVQLAATVSQDACLIGSHSAAQLPAELPLKPTVRGLTVEDFFIGTPFGPSGAIIRRVAADEIGGFDDRMPGRGAEDRDMWLRLVSRYPAYVVESPCWWYREHGEQMSRNADVMYENLSWVVRKFFREHSQYLHLRSLAMSFLCSDAAIAYIETGRRLKAIPLILQSLWWHPTAVSSPYASKVWGRRLPLLFRSIVGEKSFKKFLTYWHFKCRGQG